MLWLHRRLEELLPCCLVCAVLVLVTPGIPAQTDTFAFVQLDDPDTVIDNPQVWHPGPKNGWSAANLLIAHSLISQTSATWQPRWASNSHWRSSVPSEVAAGGTANSNGHVSDGCGNGPCTSCS